MALILLAASCNDTPTSDESSTTTTTAPPSTAGTGLLRAAQLAFDAHSVDVVINGQAEMTVTVAYPGVSDYVELVPGEYRVQFFPAGSRRSALMETTLSLAPDEEATVALVGLSSFDIAVLEDNRASASSGAAVTMVNAIPDFPAALDAAIVNGPRLFQNVSYLETSEVAELVPGIYDIEARRAGTDESVATTAGNDFEAGRSYTVFAAGSLTRRDMTLVVASDAH